MSTPATAPTSRPNLLYADYLRVAATIGIVMLHCSATVVREYGKIPADQWWFANILNSLTRWGVPAFIMLSGMLLLPGKQDEPVGTFLQKRASRVLFPYLIWACVYLVETYVKIQIGWLQLTPEQLWTKILSGVTGYHLWFVPVILALYLLVPILRVMVQNASQQLLSYFLVLWYLTLVVEFTIPELFVIGKVESMGFVGCAVFGYYVRTYGLPHPPRWYAFGLLGLAVTVVGSWWQYSHGVRSENYFNSLAPGCMALAMGVLLWFREFDWQTFSARFPRLHRAVIWSSEISYGVYLAHVLVLSASLHWFKPWSIYLSGHRFLYWPVHPVIGLLTLTMVVIVFSGIIIAFLRKIPVLGRYIA